MQSKYSLNADAYNRINIPEYVIKWTQQGIKIPFREIQNKCFAANRVDSKVKECFIDHEIAKLAANGSIRETKVKPVCILAIQCVPKKNKKLR